MAKTYSFAEQLALGKIQELALDKHFREKGLIVVEKDDLETQRRGIDRIIVDPNTGNSWAVEYKADFAAGKTGNIFLEMIVDRKAGWVLTTEADTIVYLIVDTGKIYVISTVKLRENVSEFINTLRWATVRNERYVAYGMLLPTTILARIASKVLRLDT